MGHKVEETDQTHERKKHALTISFSSLNTQKCFLLDVVLFLEASAFFMLCTYFFCSFSCSILYAHSYDGT